MENGGPATPGGTLNRRLDDNTKPRHLPVKSGAVNAQEFSGFSFIVLGESQNINQDLSLGLEKDLSDIPGAAFGS